MKHENITERIISSFYDVYNELGPGFLESVYENSLLIALRERGLVAESQKGIHVFFRGQIVGDFRADVIVENKVLIELKACKTLNDSHIAQTLNYLKATAIEVALLVNFGQKLNLNASFVLNKSVEICENQWLKIKINA